jgi:hypothetical protein
MSVATEVGDNLRDVLFLAGLVVVSYSRIYSSQEVVCRLQKEARFNGMEWQSETNIFLYAVTGSQRCLA